MTTYHKPHVGSLIEVFVLSKNILPVVGQTLYRYARKIITPLVQFIFNESSIQGSLCLSQFPY